MTRRRWAIGFALSALVGLVVLPFALDRERKAMNAGARQSAPGQFAALRDGTLHYELAGPETGPRVVLIHGVSGPMAIWDRTVPLLTAAGYRVLRYDHVGRGYSDRIDVAHDEALYDRVLADLLDAVGWRDPIALVGSSMGAIVAAGFATRHSERVSRVVLVGPAGVPIEAAFGAQLLDVPILGAYLMRVFGDRMLSKHHRKYFVEPDRFDDIQAAFEAQLEFEGTKRSIRSTMSHMPVRDHGDGYRKLGERQVPVLLVWGRQDQTFPFAHSEGVMALVPQAVLVAIDQAAHLPQLEQPETFSRAVIGFLR
jgi:pimeloyl-ACP methyl ester carboxylesterase